MALMKFVNVRDVRNRPGTVWEGLEQDDLVLVSHGKPVAVLVRVEDGDPMATMQAIQMARAQLALSRIRQRAADTGKDELSAKAAEDIVRKTRAKRKRG